MLPNWLNPGVGGLCACLVESILPDLVAGMTPALFTVPPTLPDPCSLICAAPPGLSHLIGSPLLRAYMHGFFMDIRLYHKVGNPPGLTGAQSRRGGPSLPGAQYWVMTLSLARQVKAMANPFAYEEYRKDRIRQKIEETRAHRVQVKVRALLLGSNRLRDT